MARSISSSACAAATSIFFGTQPRLGQVPPSRSGSIIATVSPAPRVATVTPIPALPPPRITTSKPRAGMGSLPQGSQVCAATASPTEGLPDRINFSPGTVVAETDSHLTTARSRPRSVGLKICRGRAILSDKKHAFFIIPSTLKPHERRVRHALTKSPCCLPQDHRFPPCWASPPWGSNYLIYIILWSIARVIFGVKSNFPCSQGG